MKSVVGPTAVDLIFKTKLNKEGSGDILWILTFGIIY